MDKIALSLLLPNSHEPMPLSPLLLSSHKPEPLLLLLFNSHEPTPLFPLLLSSHEPVPLSPLLLSNHEPVPLLLNNHETSVSVAAQQPRAMATHQGHCCAVPGRGLSTSSTQNFRNVFPYKPVMAAGAPLLQLVLRSRNPRTTTTRTTRTRTRTTTIRSQRLHNAARAPSL